MQTLVTRLAVLRGCFRVLCQLRRTQVGLDGFFPRAHAREDMRWHMVSVRRSRRNRGILTRGTQPLLRQNRIVVAVNDVVGNTGMVRQLVKDRLENLSALALVGKRLVRLRSSDTQC